MLKSKPVYMEMFQHAEDDGVCQLIEYDTRFGDCRGKVLWGCFFNPLSDESIERMNDERQQYLIENSLIVVWN